jgi:CRISPR-associated protein Cst1
MFDLPYDIDEDFIYYNREDITEERYLQYAEVVFKDYMYHLQVKEELEIVSEFDKDAIDRINKLLIKIASMRAVFKDNKFDGENSSEIISLIDENRSVFTKGIFTSNTYPYSRFANPNLFFTDKNECCRLLGYYVQWSRKGNALTYNFTKDSFVYDDDIIFDFIPFAFTDNRDALFINDNSSIKNSISTNSTMKMLLSDAQAINDKPLTSRQVLFSSIIESSGFIDYDIEVVFKDKTSDYYETLFIRKESIKILKAIKKFYKCFGFPYKVNDNYYVDIQKEVIDAILNMTSVIELIQLLLKADNAEKGNYKYVTDKLIDVNVLISGGKDMLKSTYLAKETAKKVYAKLVAGRDTNKVRSYRTKMTSALIAKDYKRFCDILIQLAGYVDMELDFAYNLFDDFENNENVAYAFVNALGGNFENVKNENDKKEEE